MAIIKVGDKATVPSIRPSLNLDFANSKVLDPRVSFSRSSIATYYDGSTKVKAEENLLPGSEDFGETYWSWAACTVSTDATTAPNGTTTADRINFGNVNAAYIYPGSGVQTPTLKGVPYTYSIFAKAGTGPSWFWIEFYDSANKWGFFDLANGVVGGTASGVTNSIRNVGNGWYRCSITYTPTNTVGPNFGPASANFDRNITTGNIFVWGAQLEQRDTMTSYHKTTTSGTNKYQPKIMTAEANEPRFDHDPATGESKGLFVESAKTNFWTNSAQSGYSYYPGVDIYSYTGVAPDGTVTANLLAADTSGTTKIIDRYGGSWSTGSRYTFSTHVKAVGIYSKVQLGVFNNSAGTWGAASFNLSDQTIFSLTSGDTAEIKEIGNGWFRISVSGVATQANANIFRVAILNDSGSSDFTGDGYSGLLDWGWQVETGSYATSYIPTSGATAVRSSELPQVNITDSSDWYSHGQGSIFAEGSIDGVDGSQGLVGLYGTSATYPSLNWIALYASGTALSPSFSANFQNSGSGGYGAGTSFGGYVPGDDVRGAMSWSDIELNAVLNGESGEFENTSSGNYRIPEINTIAFWRLYASGFDGRKAHLRKFSYWPTQLPLTELKALAEE